VVSHTVVTAALRRVMSLPRFTGDLPPGRRLDLPGRGSTFCVDVAGPPGSEDKPTLVLLHALGCTAYLSWFPSLAALSATHRVVLFDQRWHGRGIRSEDFRFDDCADDVVAVADALHLGQVVPIGYSMGGAIAQLAWHRHRDRVAGLVLAATARNFRGKPLERMFFPVLTAGMLPLSGYSRDRVDRRYALLPEVPGVAPHLGNWGIGEFRSTSAWAMPAVLRELGRFNSADWIGEIDVPTAVVATSKDRTIPARRQLRMAECVPGASLHEVEGGHASLVLGAARFVPALVAAVASVQDRQPVARSAALQA